MGVPRASEFEFTAEAPRAQRTVMDLVREQELKHDGASSMSIRRSFGSIASALIVANSFTLASPQETRPAATAPAEKINDAGKDAQSSRGRDRMDFERNGVQIGEKAPDVKVFDLEGQPTQLASSWKEKPALIVTASLTCPISRNKCPDLKPLVEEFGDRINIVILYTIEAHPQGDDSPYRPGEGEWVTPMNQKEGILHRQPTALDERLKLARDLNQRFGKFAPMLVDDMDNTAWTKLGAGPNMALLIRADGLVEAKHGWLDAKKMKGSIEKLLQQSAATSSSGAKAGATSKPARDK